MVNDPASGTTNYGSELLASEARIASINSADQINNTARGVHIIIDVIAITGTPSVTPKIQGKDPASGKYYDILVGVAITSVGVTVMKVYPGIDPVANGASNDILPKDWRVRIEHGDEDSITYSIGAETMI